MMLGKGLTFLGTIRRNWDGVKMQCLSYPVCQGLCHVL